jgi:hypothetical protein
MQKALTILAAFAALAASGCVSTGPVVTNISDDGAGKFIVEKCNIRINNIMMKAGKTDCKETQLQVSVGYR